MNSFIELTLGKGVVDILINQYSLFQSVFTNPSWWFQVIEDETRKKILRAASDLAGCSSLRVDKETVDDNGFRIERTPSRTYPGPAPRGNIDFIHEIPYQTWISRPRRPCSCHEFKAQPSDIAIKHFFINSTSVRGETRNSWAPIT